MTNAGEAGLAFKTTVAGAVTAAASGAGMLTTHANEIALIGVIAGVFVGVGGFIAQVYFAYRKDKRENTESTWRMGVDPDRRKTDRRRHHEEDSC